MSQDHDLTTAPIPALIKKISVPVAIGFFFNTMFNVVDTYFGGKISTEALAALSISFPVFFLIIIFASGLGTGSTAVISNAIGAGERERARKIIAQSISLGLIISVALTVLGPIVSPSLFRMLGASDSYLGLAVEYMDIIFYGSVFFTMIGVLSSVLQSVGNTTAYRNFLVGGFVLNVILDPWMLYGGFGMPAFGFRGVAIATIVVQIAGTIYLFLEAKKRGLVGKDTLREMKPDGASYKEILKQAVPASINMVTVGIGIFVITYFINQFGQDAVAAYGIATRVEQIVLLPTIGITVAALSIIGQNNGAKKFSRVRETYMACMKYGVSIMAIGGVLIFALSRPIMDFFTDDSGVIDIGAHYLKIAALITIAYAILFITVSALQGMKKPMYAVWIGLFRQIAAPAIIFTLAVKYFDSIDGIWWGIFGITWLSAIITFFYGKHVLKRFDA